MSAAVRARVPSLDQGKVIGRYELCAELAVGGMGKVYLARARGPAGFEKLVALKTVHANLSVEEEFVEMFLDEARIAARIDHQNVCRVFDFGEVDGQYFIAMEYLVGAPVSSIFRRLRDTPRAIAFDAMAARIVGEAAEGLHAAHELTDAYGALLNVVHRDISPQNLFVTYDGGVRVVDFGVASARGRLHQTTAGSVKGKLTYMAPEVLRREGLDRRSDIWALGVVLWELLAGRRLIPGASEVDIILSVAQEGAPKLASVRDDVPPGLEAIVSKALALDREERYQTAREMGQALHRWVMGSGELVGMAEVASFMQQCFPEERAAAFELADAARRATELPKPSSSDSVEVFIEMESSSPSLTTLEPQPTNLRRIAMLGGAGVFALFMVGAFAFWLGSLRDDPRVAATVAIAPVRPEPAVAPAPPEPARTPGTQPSVVEPATSDSVAEEIETDVDTDVEAAVEPSRPAGRRTGRRVRARGGETPEGDDAPSTGTGEVRITTPGGWADVYVDGRRVGRTPLTTNLPIGSARVELRPFGLEPPAGSSELRRRIQVGSSPTRLEVRLSP